MLRAGCRRVGSHCGIGVPCIAPARDGRASGGNASPQRDRRSQRAWNGQPGPRSQIDGTTPGISGRSGRASSGSRSSPAGDQALRVRMQRLGQHVATGAPDDAPAIHHHDAVGHLGYRAHVVRDQHRRAAPRLLFAQQVEDLRLHGHVQRRGRLVGDQHGGCRPARWRSSRAGACRRTSGADIIHAPLRRGYAHRAQHRCAPAPPPCPGPGAAAAARRSARPP